MRTLQAALLTALIGVLATAATAVPRGATNVSQTALDSLSPVVARDGERAHVAWIESEQTTDGVRATIVAARSTDMGVSFEPPVVVAPLDGYASGLQLATSAGRVHLAWLVTSYTIGAPASVAYSLSDDGGLTFGETVVLNAETYPGPPDLVASGDRVAIVWSTESSVWLAHSDDGGARFSSPIRVADSSLDGTARVSLEASTAVLGWIAPNESGREVLCRAVDLETPDASRPPVVLADAASISEANVAFDSGVVVAVWNQGGQLEVAVSIDGGAVYDRLASPGAADTIARPRLVARDRIGHLVWLGRNASLTYGRIADGRVETRRLGTKASFPDIAAEGGRVCVVWQAGPRAGARLRAATSTDSGATFSKSTPLTRKRDGATAARVAAGAAAPLVVFEAPLGAQRDVFSLRTADNSLRSVGHPAGV